MLTFDGPVEALNALQDFLIDRPEPIPGRVHERLKDVLKERSPVVAVVNAVEAVFARQDRKEDVPQGLAEWAAAAAAMCEDHGFHGFDQDSRGSRIAKVLRGEKIAEKNIPEANQKAVEAVVPPPPPTEDQETPIPTDPDKQPQPEVDAPVADSDAPAVVPEEETPAE